ncbi:MAG: hypothetical protein IJY36_00545 [Coprobacter sp.]|nr:hypothetical protein [Coprobacter sp.]
MNIYDAFTLRELSKENNKIQKQVEQLERNKYSYEIYYKISSGLAVMYIQPNVTIQQLLQALQIAIKHNDGIMIEKSIGLMEQIPKVVKRYDKDRHIKVEKIDRIYDELKTDKEIDPIYKKRIESVLRLIKDSEDKKE